MPGSSRPSRNSREAPPPVEMCVILSAKPSFSTAAAESPPPIKMCIRDRIMGAVQLEVLQRVLKERFKMEVTFGTGSIVYRETIEEPVEGMGHFEPLRHYAEVHPVSYTHLATGFPTI